MTHPLISKELGSHYDSQEKPAIFQLEERLSVRSMIGFCEGNIFKYEYRKKHKGQQKADEQKIKTYKAYIHNLYFKGYKNMVVSFALKSEGLVYEY